MSLVGGRIDVDVRKDVVRRHTYLDAGNLGSPEEVPVLVDLQVFIPSNGLQDVTMGIVHDHDLGFAELVSKRLDESMAGCFGRCNRCKESIRSSAD